MSLSIEGPLGWQRRSYVIQMIQRSPNKTPKKLAWCTWMGIMYIPIMQRASEHFYLRPLRNYSKTAVPTWRKVASCAMEACRATSFERDVSKTFEWWSTKEHDEAAKTKERRNDEQEWLSRATSEGLQIHHDMTIQSTQLQRLCTATREGETTLSW